MIHNMQQNNSYTGSDFNEFIYSCSERSSRWVPFGSTTGKFMVDWRVEDEEVLARSFLGFLAGGPPLSGWSIDSPLLSLLYSKVNFFALPWISSFNFWAALFVLVDSVFKLSQSLTCWSSKFKDASLSESWAWTFSTAIWRAIKE